MLLRLRCHFCGTRSKASKGTTEFKCRSCEAWNFFNKKGEVIDTPARFAERPRPQIYEHSTATSSNSQRSDQGQIFCQTCLNHQRILNESLANYLPDEDHLQYYEYERHLPEYKADLEARYPQICKKCAPRAQATIAQADRYGLKKNAAKLQADTRARGGRIQTGQRDDWGKWSMRMLLHLLGWAIYASLLIQAAWHAYSLFMILFTTHTTLETLSSEADPPDMDELAFDPTLSDCSRESLRLRFYQPCAALLNSVIAKALWTSFLLIWYSPGLALWYHHTVRVEAVHGRGQYFIMQIILLTVRTLAWLNLSNASVTSELTKPQLLAAHGFMAAFIPFIQRKSERVIRFDKWRINTKMMRSPDEIDVFGPRVGSGKDTSPPQASSRPPLRLFERDDKPFPIENLAPRSTRSNPNPNLPHQPPPSPPDSQSVSEDEMDYQMEWQPSSQPQMPGAPNTRSYQPRTSRTYYNSYNYGMTQPKGWTPMRDELFGIQSQQQAEEQRKREEAEQRRLHELEYQNRSPFRGTLPPDPMQRRLRGVQPQVQKKAQPVTERSDFYEQMSKSFGSQRFGQKAAGKKNVKFADDDGMGMNLTGGLGLNDDDEDFSPVKSVNARKATSASGSGSLNLREGQWKMKDKNDATGLEDLFGGRSFSLKDEPAVIQASSKRVTGLSSRWVKVVLLTLPVALIAVGWNVVPVRRAVCLWLVKRLEGMGY